MMLVERNSTVVLTWPVIQEEFGNRFQISGIGDTQEARNLALLLRAGALAAPMDIIEERTVGPSLGAENIDKGFKSVVYGFVAIAVFMIVYYALFGVISVSALAANLLFLVALLSMLQATLTLPGIAAIALTLGMAIDANVLINERIREELRSRHEPADGHPGGLRARLRHHLRLQHHDAHRRPRAARLRLRARCAASRSCTAWASSPRSSAR